MPRLEGYTALIVGGGRGLGRSAAVAFAKAGANIAVAARTLAEINETAELVKAEGRKAIAVQTDARDIKQVESLVEKTIAEFGKIDILLNTQGTNRIASTIESTDEDWDTIMDTNLKSVYFTCRTVLPHMIKEKTGHIFNVASFYGMWYPGGGMIPIYKASKMGLIGLSKSLADEQIENGIGVHIFAPGPMDTPLRWKDTPNVDGDALLQPDTVADLMVTIASHRDLRLSEVIVPHIRLPYRTAYKKRD